MIIIDNKPKFKKYNLVKVDSILTFDYDGEQVKYRDDHFTGLIKDITTANYYIADDGEIKGKGHTSSIINIENGGKYAWYNENELVLIEENGTRFIAQAEENKRLIKERDEDINYILEHIDDEDGLASSSILYLFDLIGYRCTGFLNHGEYYSLSLAWGDLGPLFVHIKNADSFTTDDDLLDFIPICIKYNISPDDVERVFNKFHGIGD